MARSPDAIERGITRLQERIDDLLAFDVRTVQGFTSPGLTALSTAISNTVDRCFDAGTPAHSRFSKVSNLRPFRPGSPVEVQDQISERIETAVGMLKLAQGELQQDLEDAKHHAEAESAPTELGSAALSRRVFVVHGHDGEARETVARFLTKLGFEPIILHEQANQGRTIIEKFEAHGDVGFAVVLLTPDDEGRAKGGELQSRARQNVVLELGYFIGKLGRGKVCALKRGELELPSDYLGVMWERMDDGGGWRQALGREMQAAGHAIDWNAVMRP